MQQNQQGPFNPNNPFNGRQWFYRGYNFCK
jgi:hypothetical protein